DERPVVVEDAVERLGRLRGGRGERPRHVAGRHPGEHRVAVHRLEVVGDQVGDAVHGAPKLVGGQVAGHAGGWEGGGGGGPARAAARYGWALTTWRCCRRGA